METKWWALLTDRDVEQVIIKLGSLNETMICAIGRSESCPQILQWAITAEMVRRIKMDRE